MPAKLIALTLLPLLISAYFLFLKDPPVWPDEGTSLHMAKAIRQTGRINAQIYGGIPKVAAEAGLGFPPLYFMALGGWTKVFGESIESIRALSLLLGVVTLAVFYFVILNVVTKKLYPLLGSLLLSVNVFFAKASRFGRPEILTLLLILLSLLFWYRFNTPDGGRRAFVLAVLCAALASAAHPMGMIAPAVLGLAVLFSSFTLKTKIIYISWIMGAFLAVTFVWILTTQQSIPDLLTSYRLSFLGKMSTTSNIWTILTSGSVWTVLLLAQALALLALSYLAIKTKSREYLFILASALLTLVLVFWQKENYYVLYLQPFLILAVLILIKHLKLAGQMVVIGFFILINIYLQFFYIDSYIPRQTVFTIGSFDYHHLTNQIKDYLPKKPECIFLSAIPDPYLDLKDIPYYKLYQAIDPHYPVSKKEYKEVLDGCDFIIYSWLPHEFLSEYVQNNTERWIHLSQPNGYSLTIARLKSKEERI